MRREVLISVKVGPQHKSTLRANDESAEAATHYYDCGLPKCDAMLFGELLPEYGGSIPQDDGDCWQPSTNFTAYYRRSSLNAHRPELKFHKKKQGHAETCVTSGDEIKEYDLGGMW